MGETQPITITYVIKLILKRGDYPGLCEWALNPIRNILIRERQREIRYTQMTTMGP